MPQRLSLADARALDRDDVPAPERDRFALPADIICLDGNSLGPLQHSVRERMAKVAATKWGEVLIRSWNTYGWLDLPARAGAKIAPPDRRCG